MKFEKLFLIGIILIAAFLRLHQIDTNPPGLYIDEVSIGHNAYTILTTGKDEHGIVYPLWFRAFGEYKMPVYIYTVAGSMALFGKNEFAIRLPSAIAGILTIPVIFLFAKLLLNFKDNKKIAYAEYVPLLSAFFLAISSWHVHFSRGGFEVTLGLFLYLTGLLFLLYYIKNNQLRVLLIGMVLLLLSAYTYNSFRVIAPLSVMIAAVYLCVSLPRKRRHIVGSIVFFGLLLLPLVLFSLSEQGSARFMQTSAFSEYPVSTVFEKAVTYPMVFLKNYISYFSFHFLFNYGDGIGRHQMVAFGLLYRFEFILLFSGILYFLTSKKTVSAYIIVGLLLLSVVPAALTRPSPHTLRSLPMVVPLTVMISYGVMFLLQRFRQYGKVFIIFLLLVGSYEQLYTLHFYSSHYPKVNLLDWGAQYKEAVLYASYNSDKYDLIVVDDKLLNSQKYFDFYDSSLSYQFVPQHWQKPGYLSDKKILYMRPYYGSSTGNNLVHSVYMPNLNKDIFIQFWEL